MRTLPLFLAALLLALRPARTQPTHSQAAVERWELWRRKNEAFQKREKQGLWNRMPFRVDWECAPERGNSTVQLVRCVVAKTLDPNQVPWSEEVHKEYEKEATEYIERHLEEGLQFSKSETSKRTATGKTSSVLTKAFFEDQHLWMSTGTYPRIYTLETPEVRWSDECDEVGYWYFLENWIYKYFTQTHHHALVKDYRVADYVYVPLCIRKQLFLNSQDIELTSAGPITYNKYAGLLVEDAINIVDRDLVLAMEKLQGEPAFRDCMERPTCRFLFCSIDGRHVYRNFSNYFGNKAVWLTHMGMGTWASEQRGDLYWTDAHGLEVRGSPASLRRAEAEKDAEEVPKGCRAVCAAHCQLEPPSMLPQDVIMPWMIGYMYNQRAIEWRSRDLLAFFSGAQSCCSRRLLFDVFREPFMTSVRSSRNSLKSSALVFPPMIKVDQQRWSELAYRSKICLVPDGDCPATGRLIEVMMHGCIPMIITNRLVPPVSEYIDWKQIAFFVREDEIPALPGILAMIAQQPRKLETMHKNLLSIARFLDYALDFPLLMLVKLRGRTEELQRMQASLEGRT